MAFNADNLSIMARADGTTMWLYKTTDTAATVDTVDYFASAINYINKGDIIFAHVDTGGTPAYGLFVVNQNDGTNIDVADMVSLSATDTD